MNKPTLSTTQLLHPLANQVSLQEVVTADLPVLLTVLHAAYAEYLGKLDPPSGAHKETVESLRQKLATAHAVKAVVDQTIVGCVFYEDELANVYLSRLAVLPGHRGLGIARRLVAHVEQYAMAWRMPRVTLGVRLQMLSNIAYYTKLGYRITGYGCHPGYSEPTFARMAKNLSQS
jgi:ribosomal protein S18 acetylase RimI-like enzyme